MHVVVDRKGNIVEAGSLQDRILEGLYCHWLGRLLLKPLVSPAFSEVGGAFLDSRFSKILIPWFVRSHAIDRNEYQKKEYVSYNDFFTRKLAKGVRRVDMSPDALVSPCDSRVSVYRITKKSRFSIKNTRYTAKSLLEDQELAREYAGGYVWVFRLCVDDYHRYIYADSGKVMGIGWIPGILHTVNPVANDHFPIYKENTREYCVLQSENFGEMIQMEVGAMLVGRIRNHSRGQAVRRGWEKGRFEFGGSTVILMTKKGAAVPDRDILDHSRQGWETKVRLGERVGGRTPC
ncbi:phosphatidylserine decarboxylase [uncultured Acetatifactor sp.]|uniref:phosphatidylserine decarboxylase n=1 Tax=uncultured Acetatifactor sp. TaxID=1671927 RepID=UPI002603DA64|nr:phosphatidylserine decarboxylase [uncultured Acetatifactor sp.]